MEALATLVITLFFLQHLRLISALLPTALLLGRHPAWGLWRFQKQPKAHELVHYPVLVLQTQRPPKEHELVHYQALVLEPTQPPKEHALAPSHPPEKARQKRESPKAHECLLAVLGDSSAHHSYYR